jgi:tetratricopeptide (TPR) repeat protein
LGQFDRVLELDPYYHAAYYHKAALLIELGRSDLARAVLTSGLAATRAAGDAHAESEMGELLAGLS